MLDATDLKILAVLKENARLQWKDIGAAVHMTGQAVAARIRRLEELGVIRGYAALVDEAKLGKPLCAYVTVFMENNDHAGFQSFVARNEEIVEAHRVSGGGCYLLKVNVADNDELNQLLDRILKFGNYGVSLSIGRIK